LRCISEASEGANPALAGSAQIEVEAGFDEQAVLGERHAGDIDV
jgi:hypothetical protein